MWGDFKNDEGEVVGDVRYYRFLEIMKCDLGFILREMERLCMGI